MTKLPEEFFGKNSLEYKDKLFSPKMVGNLFFKCKFLKFLLNMMADAYYPQTQNI